MTTITLRKAKRSDYEQVLEVERQSTPGLQYLPFVYEMFSADERGEFTVAEIDGVVVACAKFTVLPDNSAWLETIRVTPERQGLGIGKRFYENYFEIAAREGISTMRMYTGIRNVVSKGLAERFGFELAETFYGMTRAVETPADVIGGFEIVVDGDEVLRLVEGSSAEFQTYLTMNRTFYRLTPILIKHLAASQSIYTNGTDVVIAGARFMPQTALHISYFAGNPQRCLAFANRLAHERGIPQLSCLFPISQPQTKQALLESGFQLGKSEFIVMERHIL